MVGTVILLAAAKEARVDGSLGGKGGSGTGKRHFNMPILFSVNEGPIGEDDSFAFNVMEEVTCFIKR